MLVQFLYGFPLLLKMSTRFLRLPGKLAVFLNPNRQCDHLCLYAQLFTVCLQIYHRLNMLFWSLMCVMWLQEQACQLGSLLVPLIQSDFLEDDRGAGGPGCCPVSLTCFKKLPSSEEKSLERPVSAEFQFPIHSPLKAPLTAT